MNSSPTIFSLEGKRVWVAGHRGMVGSALVRQLAKEPIAELLTVGREELDLCDPTAVEAWMAENRPDVVIVAAAKVGGIFANDNYPADFIHDNLAISMNIVHASWKFEVEKLLYLGSSCIYPKHAAQPMSEDALLSGPLEPTNEWYAIAKIAGIKLCQAYRKQHGCDFISAMPTNLYGPGDSFDLKLAHVVPSLMRKAHEAKMRGEHSLTVWGSGTPMREFMHVDDCAAALIHMLKVYSDAEHVNVGSGEEVTIAEIARMLMDVVGLTGELVLDDSKPDGTMRKLMSTDKLRALGWAPEIALKDGLGSAYDWFVEHYANIKASEDS